MAKSRVKVGRPRQAEERKGIGGPKRRKSNTGRAPSKWLTVNVGAVKPGCDRECKEGEGPVWATSKTKMAGPKQARLRGGTGEAKQPALEANAVGPKRTGLKNGVPEPARPKDLSGNKEPSA